MCKEHFNEALGLFAAIGSNLPDCVEFVGLVRDRDRNKETIISTLTIDETVDRARLMLKLAEDLQRQAQHGVLHAGDTPPTAH